MPHTKTFVWADMLTGTKVYLTSWLIEQCACDLDYSPARKARHRMDNVMVFMVVKRCR